jgi:pyruvate dehydrogenase phosphatase
MPSRSFGDLYLKHPEFNNPTGFTSIHGFRKPRIRDFTGPYITHKPDIVVVDKNPNDRYIILATDGLWDEMDEQTAA